MGQIATHPVQPIESGEAVPQKIVVRGHFRILAFFDIAEAIDLDGLRVLLGPDAAPRSPGFAHLTPEYAQAQNPPIVERVNAVGLPTGETLDARIKYYWFGVASVELITPFECDFAALPARK